MECENSFTLNFVDVKFNIVNSIGENIVAINLRWKVVETMVARFSECTMVTHWFPHTLIQISFRLVLVHKIVWCSLQVYKLEFWQ